MIRIIGSGPAGLACGYTLLKSGFEDFIIYDKQPLEDRRCNILEGGVCSHCNPCSIVNGVGGAGLFSDAKIVGTQESLEPIYDFIFNNVLQGEEFHYHANYGDPFVSKVEEDTKKAGLQYDNTYSKTLHLGSDGGRRFIEVLVKKLDGHFDKYWHTGKRLWGAMGEWLRYHNWPNDPIVISTGRPSYREIKRFLDTREVSYYAPPVDIGIRVEVPKEVLDSRERWGLYDFKLYTEYEDKVRTFCICHGGHVIAENHNGMLVPNGIAFSGNESPYSNFTILVSIPLTDPVKDGAEYAESIMRISNLLSKGSPNQRFEEASTRGGGIMVQWWGDVMEEKRSKIPIGRKHEILDANLYPGDLRLAIPARYWNQIEYFLDKLSLVFPEMDGYNTLLYGTEVKFYPVIAKNKSEGGRILDSDKPLYIIGDAGGTRGIAKAIESGIKCAEELLG
jgi:hypothetical protein